MLLALKEEMRLRQSELRNEPLETIYFGGGTPSILSKEELEGILREVRRMFKVTQDAEITLEANPDDLSYQTLKDFKSVGVNRLSIGIQSFFDEHLKWMNRAHTVAQAYNTIQWAQELGFENITIDLIYGIPMMSDDQWAQNVTKAIDLKVPHISAYNLTVEHKTKLDHMVRNGESPGIDDVQGERNFLYLKERLVETGFVHYEISNFGKEGYFSKHNTSYWQGKSYLGIGPSAHSFDGAFRRWNVANNNIYVQKISSGKMAFEEEQLTPTDCANEHIMIGLRNIWGCSWEKLLSFGVDLAELRQKVAIKISQGYLQKTEEGFKTTQKGLLFADGLASELFLE